MRPFHPGLPHHRHRGDAAFLRRTVLGCRIGRESPGKWIDFDLFGHGCRRI